MTNRYLAAFAIVASLIFSGCTLPSANGVVPQAQVGVAATISQGRVISSEPVTIEGDRSTVGSAGGAAVGAAAASGGRFDTEGIIVGAVGATAGAVMGQAIEEAATRKRGQRITIMMDDGTLMEVVQEASDGYFREGDRVNVAIGNGNTRVSMSIGMDAGSTPISAEPAWYEGEERERSPGLAQFRTN